MVESSTPYLDKVYLRKDVYEAHKQATDQDMKELKEFQKWLMRFMLAQSITLIIAMAVVIFQAISP